MNTLWDPVPYGTFGKSRAINAENRTGEKGKGGMASSCLGRGRKGSPCLKNIQPGENVLLADIEGCGVINHIWITVDTKTLDGDCFVLRDLILRMTWDDSEHPAVEVPIGDFFCCGFGKECRVTSYPITVLPSCGLNSYFSMPFRTHARIEICNQHKNPIPVFFYQIDYCLYENLLDPVLYFHASWNRERVTTKGRDYEILGGVKGRGIYVGTYIALQTLERYWWGEGEVKFYLDGDTDYPTICGTGMEDYVGGSWSFAVHEGGKTVEQIFSTPYLGYPYYSNHDDTTSSYYHNDDCPPMRGMYRFHIPDPIYFEENIRVTLQQIGASHNGLFERQDDVASVAYWYQENDAQNEYRELAPSCDRWPR